MNDEARLALLDVLCRVVPGVSRRGGEQLVDALLDAVDETITQRCATVWTEPIMGSLGFKANSWACARRDGHDGRHRSKEGREWE